MGEYTRGHTNVAFIVEEVDQSGHRCYDGFDTVSAVNDYLTHRCTVATVHRFAIYKVGEKVPIKHLERPRPIQMDDLFEMML